MALGDQSDFLAIFLQPTQVNNFDISGVLIDVRTNLIGDGLATMVTD